ncbi:precorrin-3B C(17)-methyltransferase [candidate division KSB3 bacterium]|uniref:Precorrin-3B C(17)-methyltransferase n=1 Tax=candidate division KSB3 bacterium TaxID=2044937 RepID=A0A2G6EAR7_9BACT|nr:MAG: precorrin-3B C(17)-methyltransferase [candidate division KSB3 bacterium]PIE30909.1 MAG: precorrin-3B C(17)-methyltransferase [candidate division KSB3 bacterium]
MAKLYVVGIGPGGKEHLTLRALDVLKQCEVVVGYTFYLELIQEFLEGKTLIETGMTGEIERCCQAIEQAKCGKTTCIVSTGDAGLYGMAGPILEMAEEIDVEIVPGVSSVFAAAAEIGAPLMHDLCIISLSDLLTPWTLIETRLKAAGQGDFVVALYNPKSRGRVRQIETAIRVLAHYKAPDTPVALVKNAGRAGSTRKLLTLSTIDYDFIDMKTLVIIGNRSTHIKNGKMLTPRGYML